VGCAVLLKCNPGFIRGAEAVFNYGMAHEYFTDLQKFIKIVINSSKQSSLSSTRRLLASWMSPIPQTRPAFVTVGGRYRIGFCRGGSPLFWLRAGEPAFDCTQYEETAGPIEITVFPFLGVATQCPRRSRQDATTKLHAFVWIDDTI